MSDILQSRPRSDLDELIERANRVRAEFHAIAAMTDDTVARSRVVIQMARDAKVFWRAREYARDGHA